MKDLYQMPASHPAVHAGVEQLKAWGAPGDVEYYDYVDVWGWPTHEVRFHSGMALYDTIAGLIALNPDGSFTPTMVIAYNEMRTRGMVDTSKPGPEAPKPKQPGNPAIVDEVIGAPDPNRPGLYEPSAGTNPMPGALYTSADGRQWIALQVAFGFGGAAVNIRWRQQ